VKERAAARAKAAEAAQDAASGPPAA